VKFEHFSTGKHVKKCTVVLGIVFGFLMVMILIPAWKQAAAIRRIEKEAAAYLDEKYPGHDFLLEVYYGEKRERYVVEVKSQSSRDTWFELEHRGGYDGFAADTYESWVSTCATTRQRVAEEYETAVLNALPKDFSAYVVEADFHGAQGSSRAGKVISAPETVEWVLDQEYDAAQIGAQIGYVVLWFDDTDNQYPRERREELVCQAVRALEEADVGFYAIDIMLADELTYGSPVFHFEKRIYARDADAAESSKILQNSGDNK